LRRIPDEDASEIWQETENETHWYNTTLFLQILRLAHDQSFGEQGNIALSDFTFFQQPTHIFFRWYEVVPHRG